MSNCRYCAKRRDHIAWNPDTRMKPLCIMHQQAQAREHPSITATLSREAHGELKAMAKADGHSLSRMMDLLIRAEHRRRQRPAGWGS